MTGTLYHCCPLSVLFNLLTLSTFISTSSNNNNLQRHSWSSVLIVMLSQLGRSVFFVFSDNRVFWSLWKVFCIFSCMETVLYSFACTEITLTSTDERWTINVYSGWCTCYVCRCNSFSDGDYLDDTQQCRNHNCTIHEATVNWLRCSSQSAVVSGQIFFYVQMLTVNGCLSYAKDAWILT